MGLISKFIIMLVANGLGLYAATVFIDGFTVPLTLNGLIIVSAVLTLINIFVRPIIKFVLSPVIILTLGLASILVNLAALYLLDYLLASVTISGILPLIYATLVLGLVNFVIHLK